MQFCDNYNEDEDEIPCWRPKAEIMNWGRRIFTCNWVFINCGIVTLTPVKDSEYYYWCYYWFPQPLPQQYYHFNHQPQCFSWLYLTSQCKCLLWYSHLTFLFDFVEFFIVSNTFLWTLGLDPLTWNWSVQKDTCSLAFHGFLRPSWWFIISHHHQPQPQVFVCQPFVWRI